MHTLNTIIAALGGAAVLLGAVGYLVKILVENSLKKEFELFQKETKRDLALNSRRDEYKKELAIRQLDAIQDMWSLFVCASLSGDEKSMIIDPKGNNPKFSLDKASNFVESFNQKFSEKSGLYLPKSTRESLHKFRNFIISNFLEQYSRTSDNHITSEQLSEFGDLRTCARIELRKAVGGYDITIAEGEYRTS